MAEPTAGQKPYDPLAFSSQELRDLYWFMNLNRLLEERLTVLYRQGQIVGGLYRSLGQEATSVGTGYATLKQDLVGPMIRNLGVFMVRGVSPQDIMAQYMAKASGPTMGRDVNTHFGDLSKGIVITTSMLGALLEVMVGTALAIKLQKRPDQVAFTWIGDGGQTNGYFHEGMNLAAVKKLPFVCIIENNGYSYSTPNHRETPISQFVLKARAYGCPGIRFDGNDVLEALWATRRARAMCQRGEGPVIMEAVTFRIRGHAEHDDAGYVPRELVERWKQQDPLARYEAQLDTLPNAPTRAERDEMRAQIQGLLTECVDKVLPMPQPRGESAMGGVYAGEKRPAVPPM
ncbi:MAG: thiamine pyrophosphate-dependent dehydrogenase E1 component subunit alpha [Deltaproteobacteria bacterium]|nr:thiamine pyrophosphate-dependent dehydrogenase E1 component subunit alpha [Deltaproteobacteria bacterium]